MPDTDNKKRLTVVLNQAPLYREAIFSLIDKNFLCRWIIGKPETDIRQLDISTLSNAVLLPLKRFIKGFYSVKGASGKAMARGSAPNILMLGEIKFATSWCILIKNRLRCKRNRKKIVLWTHGYYGTESAMQRQVMRIYFNLAHKVLFYNERSRDLAVSNGLPPYKADVIHNSLNHDKLLRLREECERAEIDKTKLLAGFFANPRLPMLVYIGRLTPQKHLSLLLEAMALSGHEQFKVNLLFIGDGPETDLLRRHAKKLSLEGNVAFMGECYDLEKSAPYIYCADACVAPGEAGLTAIHSLELGTPVVTHDNMSRQMPEASVINNQANGNGLLFKQGDAESLASVICRIVGLDTSVRTQIRESCYASLSTWTPRFQLEKINEAFKG